MGKHTRLMIFAVCIVLFFAMTPFIVGYSLGYRIDFDERKIVATGGIYLRVWPSPADVYVDSKLIDKTSAISNSIFTQDLLPKNHLVTVKKEGYFDYAKTLAVNENQVTKLEHITLFKKNISFNPLPQTEVSPFEKNVPADRQAKPVLPKNVVISDTFQNNVYFISKDKLLYKSDLEGKNQTQIFDSFYSPVKNIKISPDGGKVLYYNDYEIMYSWLGNPSAGSGQANPFTKIFLNRFSEKIGEIFWLNNDYVIFTLGSKIKISEIDVSGEINMVELPQAANSPGEIYFDHQEKKLYIKSGKEILVSEKLTQ